MELKFKTTQNNVNFNFHRKITFAKEQVLATRNIIKYFILWKFSIAEKKTLVKYF